MSGQPPFSPDQNREPNLDPASSSPPEAQQQPLEQFVTKAFVGPNGIRSGWRVLIFICIYIVFLVVGVAMVTIFNQRLGNPADITVGTVILEDGMQFAIALLAAWIMTIIEGHRPSDYGRKLADYGLPGHGAFGAKFWQGIAFGFAAITALLTAIRAFGGFYFGRIGLHGGAIVKYALLWGLAFLLVGFFEEYMARGYPLFTLTSGITFWPAAIVMSIAFGLWHVSNRGENPLGIVGVAMAGFLFCVILRKTGDLWMAIGFHAAWDWGQTYVYGVPDSGWVAPGHLFNSHLTGLAWLTGGTAGPEGSWFCIALEVILCILVALWKPEAKYPNPDAIIKPRKERAAEPVSIFFPEPPAPPMPPAPPTSQT